LAVATLEQTVAAVTTATTTIAATAVSDGAAVTTTATMAMEQTGRSRLLTAQQGQSDDREENRDTENQRAIHLESSYRYTETYVRKQLATECLDHCVLTTAPSHCVTSSVHRVTSSVHCAVSSLHSAATACGQSRNSAANALPPDYGETTQVQPV